MIEVQFLGFLDASAGDSNDPREGGWTGKRGAGRGIWGGVEGLARARRGEGSGVGGGEWGWVGGKRGGGDMKS